MRFAFDFSVDERRNSEVINIIRFFFLYIQRNISSDCFFSTHITIDLRLKSDEILRETQYMQFFSARFSTELSATDFPVATAQVLVVPAILFALAKALSTDIQAPHF
jgi:hypothetical protein